MSTARRYPPEMDLEETADYLGLTQAQVLELVRSGELAPVRPGPRFNLEIMVAWKSRNLVRIISPTPPEQ